MQIKHLLQRVDVTNQHAVFAGFFNSFFGCGFHHLSTEHGIIPESLIDDLFEFGAFDLGGGAAEDGWEW